MKHFTTILKILAGLFLILTVVLIFFLIVELFDMLQIYGF